MGMDWILELPKGQENAWLKYWNALLGQETKGTGTGLFVRPETSVRGDYAGAPTTSRFMHDYNDFVNMNPDCEPVRHLKLQTVCRTEDLAVISKQFIRTVESQRQKKMKLKPFIAGLQTVHYTAQGYYWNELHEILMRFFFAKFAEDNKYSIITWG